MNEQKHQAPTIDISYMPSVLRGLGELFIMMQEDHSEQGSQVISNDSLSAISFILEMLGDEVEKGLAEMNE